MTVLGALVRFIRWTLAIYLLLSLAPVFAKDKIVERAWLEDAGGELSLEAVQKLPLQTYSGVLSRGFGDSTIWLRLRIDPGTEGTTKQRDKRLILRIRPVYLDDIQIFDPLEPGGFAGQTGDLVHPRQDEQQGLDYLIPLARGDAPRDIWLRVQSTSTRQVDIQAIDFGELQNVSRRAEILSALYFALLVIFTIWGTSYRVFNKEGLMGAFAAMQASAMMYAFFSLGFARALWPETWPAVLIHHATSIWSMTAVSAAIFFHVLLTRDLKLPGWINWPYLTMLLLLPLKLVLLGLGLGRIALQINMAEVLVAPFVFLVASMLGKSMNDARAGSLPTLSRTVILFFYSVMAVLLFMAAAPGLALGEGNEITLHLVQIHGLLAAFIIFVILKYRAHLIQIRVRDDQLALKASQLQADHERGMREEGEKLLAMLTHELKTPLSTIQMRVDPMARGSREIKQAIRDMNGVIERCVQTLQLSDQQLKMQYEDCDLVDAIRELAQSCSQPLRISLDLPDSLLISADRQLLFVVLGNLIENACKYAAPDSQILVQTCSTQQGTEIVVRNQPGIAGWPDETHVFEKYYRSPHARRQAGTGLGLYLVRHILEAMNGKIQFIPDPVYVKFLVFLPLKSPGDLS